ncbi:MAG TPA: histidine kinase [Actinomycetales bacterium]|nr:histidine kinase [Actinomycetales bacterium]
MDDDRPDPPRTSVGAAVAAAAVGRALPGPGWVQLPRRTDRRLAVLLAGFVGLTALYLATLAQLENLGLGTAVAALVALAQVAPLAAPTAAPVLAWRWVSVALLVGAVLTPGRLDWPWPVTTMLLLAALLYLVASTHPRETVVGVWALTTAVVLLPAALLKATPAPVVVVLAGVAALVLLLGDAVRERRTARSDLAEVAALRRDDLARQAVLTERAHIARELHDLVAHHMSMIAVQAEAAPYKHRDLTPELEDTFTLIRDASREALGEMRRVVAALRTEDDDPERSPQPGVDQVPALAEASRLAGTAVEVRRSGQVRRLPDAVDVSVYRIVQEALSNARRHAPGARVDVELGYHDDRVVVVVTDDGGPG